MGTYKKPNPGLGDNEQTGDYGNPVGKLDESKFARTRLRRDAFAASIITADRGDQPVLVIDSSGRINDARFQSAMAENVQQLHWNVGNSQKWPVDWNAWQSGAVGAFATAEWNAMIFDKREGVYDQYGNPFNPFLTQWTFKKFAQMNSKVVTGIEDVLQMIVADNDKVLAQERSSTEKTYTGFTKSQFYSGMYGCDLAYATEMKDPAETAAELLKALIEKAEAEEADYSYVQDLHRRYNEYSITAEKNRKIKRNWLYNPRMPATIVVEGEEVAFLSTMNHYFRQDRWNGKDTLVLCINLGDGEADPLTADQWSRTSATVEVRDGNAGIGQAYGVIDFLFSKWNGTQVLGGNYKLQDGLEVLIGGLPQLIHSRLKNPVRDADDIFDSQEFRAVLEAAQKNVPEIEDVLKTLTKPGDEVEMSLLEWGMSPDVILGEISRLDFILRMANIAGADPSLLGELVERLEKLKASVGDFDAELSKLMADMSALQEFIAAKTAELADHTASFQALKEALENDIAMFSQYIAKYSEEAAHKKARRAELFDGSLEGLVDRYGVDTFNDRMAANKELFGLGCSSNHDVFPNFMGILSSFDDGSLSEDDQAALKAAVEFTSDNCYEHPNGFKVLSWAGSHLEALMTAGETTSVNELWVKVDQAGGILTASDYAEATSKNTELASRVPEGPWRFIMSAIAVSTRVADEQLDSDIAHAETSIKIYSESKSEAQHGLAAATEAFQAFRAAAEAELHDSHETLAKLDEVRAYTHAQKVDAEKEIESIEEEISSLPPSHNVVSLAIDKVTYNTDSTSESFQEEIARKRITEVELITPDAADGSYEEAQINNGRVLYNAVTLILAQTKAIAVSLDLEWGPISSEVSYMLVQGTNDMIGAILEVLGFPGGPDEKQTLDNFCSEILTMDDTEAKRNLDLAIERIMHQAGDEELQGLIADTAMRTDSDIHQYLEAVGYHMQGRVVSLDINKTAGGTLIEMTGMSPALAEAIQEIRREFSQIELHHLGLLNQKQLRAAAPGLFIEDGMGYKVPVCDAYLMGLTSTLKGSPPEYEGDEKSYKDASMPTSKLKTDAPNGK
ncbi:MAG: hypothetical protein CMF69_00480 [Magnetovibrio sp.]|nr:hypothetical protein [Magnetovibrio sp.]